MYSLIAVADVKAKTSRTSVRVVILYLFLCPLSQPRSSPRSPEPRHNSQRDLTNVPSLSLRGPPTQITIKFLLTSDITGSLETGTTPSETVRTVMSTVFITIVVFYMSYCVYLKLLAFLLSFYILNSANNVFIECVLHVFTCEPHLSQSSISFLKKKIIMLHVIMEIKPIKRLYGNLMQKRASKYENKYGYRA